MHGNNALLGSIRALAAGWALLGSGLPLIGTEATIGKTSLVEHWVTNAIEIRMPDNRFVNEYHTNWYTLLRTNVVDVFATNRVTQFLTNLMTVEATWTNLVTAYETNWNMRKLTNLVVLQATRTNVVTACQTNWSERTVTNHMTVNVLRTNFVDRYHTNWSAVNLTNWQTVVLLQTNWITVPVTNVVHVDLPARPAAAAPAADTEPSLLPGAWSGPVTLEAAKSALPTANNLAEVHLKARWSARNAAPLQVQSWRIEREDGTVLLFGQDQTFQRQLPIGKYKVEAKVRAEGDNVPLTVRGTLSVMAQEATIQQRLLVRK